MATNRVTKHSRLTFHLPSGSLHALAEAGPNLSKPTGCTTEPVIDARTEACQLHREWS